MSSSRLVRGAKSRLFACLCLVGLAAGLLYLFHGTQARLADLQKVSNGCNQQLESLSAQLQVIFEYKLRLEKSLNKEKNDHQSTKEACKSREKDERETREREKTEAVNKYDALVQQSKIQKSQCEDDKESYEKKLTNLKEEKTQLETTLQSVKENLKDKESALDNLKTKYTEIEDELKRLREHNEELTSKNLPYEEKFNRLQKQTVQLNNELKTAKNSLDECKTKLENEARDNVKVVEPNADADNNKEAPKPDNTNALEPPRIGLSTSNSSTTPGINPDAVSNQELSSAKPSVSDQKKEAAALILPPPKRSTQESAVVRLEENAEPLVQPMQNNVGGGETNSAAAMMIPANSVQIPVPPKPPSPEDAINKPNTRRQQQQQQQQEEEDNERNNLGPLNPVAGADDGARAAAGGAADSGWLQERGQLEAQNGRRRDDRLDNDDEEHDAGYRNHRIDLQSRRQQQQQQQQSEFHNNNNNNNRADLNNAIEDIEDVGEPRNFLKQRGENPEIPRPAKGHVGDYHGGDYDKEPPEQEEDDEGEQMDYIQGNNNADGRREEDAKPIVMIQQQIRHVDDDNGGAGVMVNPK